MAGDAEAQVLSSGRKRGGWITFPFIAVALAGAIIGGLGWLQNLLVYLIEVFHVNPIKSVQISNIVHGTVGFFPVLAAVLADGFFGPFSVIAVFFFISLLGTIFLTLTATISSLKPDPCLTRLCDNKPTHTQFAVLYTALALATVGVGCTRFILSTMGAVQFDKPKQQATFFNWYFFVLYAASVVSTTVMLYIEESVSWGLGFGLCAGANFLGLIVFLLGFRVFRHVKPKGSPYTQLARVVIASITKWKVSLSSNGEDYYNNPHPNKQPDVKVPADSFRFLNRAALKTEGDLNTDGTIAKQWRICTVQEVEDFKTVIRTFPLFTTSLFLLTPFTMASSFIVLQALTMDRHLGSHFKMPAASVIVMILFASCVTIAFIERLGNPLWKKLRGQLPTPLQRIGVGHVLNSISMVAAALVERKRLDVVHDHNLELRPRAVVPMSACWLFIPLVLLGISEAFHFPGQVAFYYQEFPASLHTSATAMIPLVLGCAFYLSTALIDFIDNITNWLPANINTGRVDNLYWFLAVVGAINFGYYLICSKFYKYQNVEKEATEKAVAPVADS